MKDTDTHTHFDPVTGLPIYDDQCSARRWMEALDEGPGFPTAIQVSPKLFGTVGAGTTPTQNTTRVLPTGACQMHRTMTHTIITPTTTRASLPAADYLSTELLAQLFIENGYAATIEESCVLIDTPTHPASARVLKDFGILEFSGVLELKRCGSLTRKMRFINWLNNAIPAVRFSLFEKVDPENPIDRIASPDSIILWADLALPLASGLGEDQILEALTMLVEAIDSALVSALEDGLVDLMEDEPVIQEEDIAS